MPNSLLSSRKNEITNQICLIVQQEGYAGWFCSSTFITGAESDKMFMKGGQTILKLGNYFDYQTAGDTVGNLVRKPLAILNQQDIL